MISRFSVLIVLFASCFASICCGHEPVSVVLTYDLDDCGSSAPDKAAKPDLTMLVNALNKRIGERGSAKALENKQIQVDVFGDINKDNLESLKQRISSAGCLEFRILADSEVRADAPIIKLAKSLPAAKKDVLLDGKKVALWVPYRQAEFGGVDEQRGGQVKRLANKEPEMLVLLDEMNVTGRFLTRASKGEDERGGLAIHFSLNKEGAARFRRLTSQNAPLPSGLVRHLGVIFDKQLLSAPTIRSVISEQGMISGGSMKPRDVDAIVDSLNSGSLPRVVRLVGEVRVGEKK